VGKPALARGGTSRSQLLGTLKSFNQVSEGDCRISAHGQAKCGMILGFCGGVAAASYVEEGRAGSTPRSGRSLMLLAAN